MALSRRCLSNDAHSKQRQKNWNMLKNACCQISMSEIHHGHGNNRIAMAIKVQQVGCLYGDTHQSKYSELRLACNPYETTKRMAKNLM
tara:strand:- start:335 stop:598 length:264 start_codon:yes stop_codon:yes gene_type:complete